MDESTALAPLDHDRAVELLALMEHSQTHADSAIALDADGRVLGVVGADDRNEEHLLRDLDVHA